MVELPSFSFALVIATYGAVFIAFIYQLILYLHSRNVVLRNYNFYLGWIFLYLNYRLFNEAHGGTLYRILLTSDFVFFPDEWMQMIGFMLYIRFLSLALELKKEKAPFSYLFAKFSSPIIISYLILHAVFYSFGYYYVCNVLYIIIRVYLLTFGILGLLYALKSKSSTFLYYLSAGAVSIILFGAFSLYVSLAYDRSAQLLISAFGYINLGFLFEIIFFSAAMAVNFQNEIKEKKRALSKVLEQKLEIQAKEIEKIEAVFKSRETERNRIAQDLHDDLGGTLTSIRLYSELIVEVMKNDPQQAEQLLVHVMNNTNEVVENMGDIIWAINLSKLKNTTFGERIKDYIFKLNVKNEINFHIQVPDWFDEGLTQPNHRKNLILIVKEAVNNIYKYSKANTCTIKVEQNGSFINLSIIDNGIGFDPSNILTGNGLSSMEHRIESIGGTLQINSKIGERTELIFSFPLHILEAEHS